MTFHIHTYGCQMNVRDSEAMETLLDACGYMPASSEDEADLVLVNTCSVRGKAEDKALGKLGLLCATKRERPDRIVGVMGCMAQRLREDVFKRVPALDFSLGTRSASMLPSVLERVRAGEAPCGAWEGAAGGEEDVEERGVLTGHHGGRTQAFVTILLGCERRCSYCIVPDVRGREYSRPADAILREVRGIVEDGAREVTLLGQSVMRYGVKGDIWPADYRSAMGFEEPLPRLFEMLAREVPELRRIRFTSGHPSGATAELARAMRELPAMCHHLHLPVQSGSNRILKSMGRGYTRESYLESVARLRAELPDLAITSDVIVGYPGETADDFEMTASLLEEAAIDNTYIFKYSPRPGTRAALMEDDVPEEEKMRRNQVLLAEQDRRGTALNKRWLGRTVEVMVEGVSLRNAERWSGRTSQNKIVVFEPRREIAPGDFVSVLVTAARPQTLQGDCV